MKQPDVYRVLVVDDHHMMRVGLKAFAQTNEAVTVQWFEAGNLAAAMAQYRERNDIDLVLLDLNLPDSQGLQSIQRFLAAFPDASIAVHSATEDELVVQQALALGVIGFMSKSLSADSMLELLMTLLARVRGRNGSGPGHPITPRAAGIGRAHDVLSPTQLKVLELVLAGMDNREIADECHLALGTVKNAVSSIMFALNAKSRSHLVSMFR